MKNRIVISTLVLAAALSAQSRQREVSELKYRVEYALDEDVRSFHFSEVINQYPTQSTQPLLVLKLNDMLGIESIVSGKYFITVRKAATADWLDIESRVIRTAKVELAPQGALVRLPDKLPTPQRQCVVLVLPALGSEELPRVLSSRRQE